MSEVQSGGVQAEDLSEDSVSEVNQSEKDLDKKEKVIHPGNHERAVKDVSRLKSKVKELESLLSERDKALETKEQERLAEQQDWKTLAENYKTKYETESNKNKDFWNSYYQNEKKNAVFKEALKAGLRKEAEVDLDLLQFDEVAIEKTDQGRVLVHGADSFVEQLKSNRPHWFQTKGAANINSGGTNKPELNPETLDAKTMAELNLKDPKKFRELWPKYVAAAKSRIK